LANKAGIYLQLFFVRTHIEKFIIVWSFNKISLVYTKCCWLGTQKVGDSMMEKHNGGEF